MDARDIVASLRPSGSRIDHGAVEAALAALRAGQSVAVVGNLLAGRYELTTGLAAAAGAPLISALYYDPNAPTSVATSAIVLDAPSRLSEHGRVDEAATPSSSWAQLTDTPPALGVVLVHAGGRWSLGDPSRINLT